MQVRTFLKNSHVEMPRKNKSFKIAKFVKANKTKGYSTRYINDFNGSSSFEPIYDYDNTKTEIEKVPIQQDATKNDEIYPDPEDFHKKLLNKSRLGNQNHGEDASVIKICKLNELRDGYLMISIRLCLFSYNSRKTVKEG